MPGHKGRGPLGCEELDITEIAGADELYEAEGIIAQSEANATQLFGIAGRSKSKWVAWLSKPGLWLQKLTTREPDASQIEVAIESMKPCIPENKEDDRW